jgi:hypothetical protein
MAADDLDAIFNAAFGRGGSKLIDRLLHQAIKLLMIFLERVQHEFDGGHGPKQTLHAPQQSRS